jgi:hypothetical protein
MKALIFENKVVDLVEQEFDVSSSMIWMDAPEGCETGWLLEDGALVTYDKRTDEQKSADNLKDLRNARDSLLAETDWWASSDLTMTAEQTAYRQALRDITETYSSLDDVVFPTKPE